MIRSIHDWFGMVVEFNSVEEMASTLSDINDGEDWRPDPSRIDGGLVEGRDYEIVE